MKEMILPNKVMDESVDEFIAKEMDKIRSDKDFYQIVKSLGDENNVITQGIVKDNIGKLSDWFEDYTICKHCKGYDHVQKQCVFN